MTVKINQICNYIDILGLSMIPKFNKGAPRAYILFLYKVIISNLYEQNSLKYSTKYKQK